MPTPSKTTDVLKFEKKSHRTKGELDQRKKAEDALITGKHMQLWPSLKNDPDAKKEFSRVKGLLKKIDKDDALYQSPVNRLALLHSECLKIERDIQNRREDLEIAETAFYDKQLKADAYLELRQGVYKSIEALGRMKNTKERMQLQIEKEMALTLAAALRSIPKKVQDPATEDPMSAILNMRPSTG
jgi:hypothetical protein